MTPEAGKYYWAEESDGSYSGFWCCEQQIAPGTKRLSIGYYVPRGTWEGTLLFPEEIKREATPEEIMRVLL